MKAGIFLFALVWFLGSTYLGYRLTERNFSEMSSSGDASSASAETRPTTQPLEMGVIKDQLPPALLEKAKTLSPGQLLCLQASISPARVSAVLAGDITPQEAAAVKKCLD